MTLQPGERSAARAGAAIPPTRRAPVARALLVAAVCLGALLALLRGRGVIDRFRLRTWYGEKVVSTLGDAPPGAPPRATVTCASLAVLVLDDHSVATRVAERLAQLLGELTGLAVPVCPAAAAPYVADTGDPVDVLALVDRVHLEAIDAGVFQRCQVRLNVTLGRPPRAAFEGRDVVRGADGVLGPEASFALEYSIDGHWQVIGLAASERKFEAAAASIEAGLGPLVRSVDWRVVPAAPPRRVADARPLPVPLPAGEVQHVYDVVSVHGARESLVQVTTAGDWRAALTEAARAAEGAGWVRSTGLSRVVGTFDSAVFLRGDERLELALTYMQDSVRDAREQRQMLTLLHRVGAAE